MARNHKHGSFSAVNRWASNRWASLTWGDLENWAGSRSVTRGRAYQRQGRVHDLAVSPEGRLLATVVGGDSYHTAVWLQSEQGGNQEASEGEVRSRCTCPVGYDGCKHAVAVTAAYLQRLSDGVEVNETDASDRRWRMFDHPDEDERRPENPPSDDRARQHIESKTREELIDLVQSLIQRFPVLREEFTEHLMLKEGNADHLATEARRELETITAEPGWYAPWDDEGWIPDYGRLKRRLERLVELGHYDAVVALGPEILDRGLEQVGMSDDEGETAMALGECVPVLFDAAARSSLSASEKLLFAIDAVLKDDYGVIDDAANALHDAQYKPSDWSRVSDELMRRLETMSKSANDEFHVKHLRDSITDWLARALIAASRADEILPIYEREARLTSSYQRLVRFLIDRKQYDEAERWAKEGIENTSDKWRGIAIGLAGMMRELADRRGRKDIVASHAAQQFFAQPSRHTFEELDTAARRIKDKGVQQKVRQAAFYFLETGNAPVRVTKSKQQGRRFSADPDWPLPVPDALVASIHTTESERHRPRYDVLLEMALADERIDDVLHWYEQLQTERSSILASRRYPGAGYADTVAQAVASSHPQKALDIYRQGLDANLPTASPAAYEACANYLQKMKPIMQSLGREDEWTQLLADIRTEYRRRPRFMEVLDRLDGQTIVQARRNRDKRR